MTPAFYRGHVSFYDSRSGKETPVGAPSPLEQVAAILRGEGIRAPNGEILYARTPHEIALARDVEAMALEKAWQEVRWIDVNPQYQEPE